MYFKVRVREAGPSEANPLLKHLAEKQRQAKWHQLFNNARPGASSDCLRDRTFLELILMKDLKFGDPLPEQESRNFADNYINTLRQFQDRVQLPDYFQDWFEIVDFNIKKIMK